MRALAACAAALLAIPLLSRAADAPRTLDDGLLDPSWFGPGVEFRTTGDVDYLWVKPGFTVKGKTLRVAAWSDPVMLDEKRDAKDVAKATELTAEVPDMLRGALAASLRKVATVSKDEGDLVVTGRFVDCNAGSKTAKWLVGMGAGAAAATWDLKIADAASGETLVAVHHRAISGTSMSNEEDKIRKWAAEFGRDLAGDLAIYAAGKPAKK